jgi:predicted polyphosphate/ATP-dependent NAD kinase
MTNPKKLLGVIVNPKAGLGGRVGLKGSDGNYIQHKALALGAVPHALERTEQALAQLHYLKNTTTLVTYPDEMGADAAQGFETQIIGTITSGKTTAQDTQRAAQQMAEIGVDFLLFAGGDGTARDIFDAIGASLPMIGIPAGVKIHSSVYAVNPRAAGKLAAMFLEGRITGFQEAEVMDVDEQALRGGIFSTKLYGYLKVPYEEQFVQHSKSPTPASDAALAREIAAFVAGQMEADVVYIIGPGTTTRAIAEHLGLEKTLIGVDVILKNQVIVKDANESRLLSILADHPRAKIIITPIGGQGYLLGRGNQQISPQVIRMVGKDNLIIVSTINKLLSLKGRPLLVDTGDEKIDRLLQGYIRVTTGYNQSMIYRVSA